MFRQIPISRRSRTNANPAWKGRMRLYHGRLEDCPVFPVDERSALVSELLSTKIKFWFNHLQLGRCFCKQIRLNTGEDWSEKAAAEIASVLGLPHARYELELRFNLRPWGQWFASHIDLLPILRLHFLKLRIRWESLDRSRLERQGDRMISTNYTLNYLRFGLLLLSLSGLAHTVCFGQVMTEVDLSAPRWQSHAKLPQHNPPGPTFQESLAEARQKAGTQGIPWKGLEFITTDGPPIIVGKDSSGFVNMYQSLACKADMIVVGRIVALQSHVSEGRTGLYTDYAVKPEAVLKSNIKAPGSALSSIAVTRPGGVLQFAEGKATQIVQEFPQLQAGASYLMFLRHIPSSGGYEPYGGLATLASNAERWTIFRDTYSGIHLPEMARGEFEKLLALALQQCQ